MRKIVLNYIVTQTDEKEVRDLIELFNQIDENSDGFITNKEFCNALRNKKNSSKKLGKIFDGLDFDKNGKITYTEFISALISKEIYLNEDKLRQAFKLFDQDGDGEITFTELRNIIGKECNVKFTD